MNDFPTAPVERSDRSRSYPIGRLAASGGRPSHAGDEAPRHPATAAQTGQARQKREAQRPGACQIAATRDDESGHEQDEGVSNQPDSCSHNWIPKSTAAQASIEEESRKHESTKTRKEEA